MHIACPHCRGEVEQTPDLAGSTVVCPHCARPFVMPAVEAAPVVTHRISRSSTGSSVARRSSSGGELLTVLMIGVLISNLVILSLVVVWEMRFQNFREGLRQSIESMDRMRR